MHPWVCYLGNNNEHVIMASMLMFTLPPQTMCYMITKCCGLFMQRFHWSIIKLPLCNSLCRVCIHSITPFSLLSSAFKGLYSVETLVTILYSSFIQTHAFWLEERQFLQFLKWSSCSVSAKPFVSNVLCFQHLFSLMIFLLLFELYDVWPAKYVLRLFFINVKLGRNFNCAVFFLLMYWYLSWPSLIFYRPMWLFTYIS